MKTLLKQRKTNFETNPRWRGALAPPRPSLPRGRGPRTPTTPRGGKTPSPTSPRGIGTSTAPLPFTPFWTQKRGTAPPRPRPLWGRRFTVSRGIRALPPAVRGGGTPSRGGGAGVVRRGVVGTTSISLPEWW